jgi:hypothetical protein
MGCYDLVPIARLIFAADVKPTPGADVTRLAIKSSVNKNPADLSSGGVIFSIRQHLGLVG